MSTDGDPQTPLTEMLADPKLAEALDSDQFKQFMDNIPIAIAVAELRPEERITYVNLEFERLAGQPAAELMHLPWDGLTALASPEGDERSLGEAIAAGEDDVGSFRLVADGVSVDAWSNIIQDEQGAAQFRLVALAKTDPERDVAAMRARFAEKDLLLRELQHRVKNNLQMITSLIRLESRQAEYDDTSTSLDRLAGRVGALALLYNTMLEGKDSGDSIDLGTYLSEIAAAVMKAHAVEGVRLDLKVDAWPVSVNVAMPTGLVVNEVLTNALKHAFTGREAGTITLHSLVDDAGCTVTIGDDGVGLPEGLQWPTSGRLGALIVQSLRQNVGATLNVASEPGRGLRVMIRFTRAKAAPGAD